MPTYIGFSTLYANQPKTTNATDGIAGGPGGIRKNIIPGKKYRMVDEQLVLQDFINALNIRQGEKVGQPEYGTTLWTFVFEPNVSDSQFKLEQEIRRVASLDPRLQLNYVKAFPNENGILIECELAISPFNNAKIFNIFLSQGLNQASLK